METNFKKEGKGQSPYAKYNKKPYPYTGVPLHAPERGVEVNSKSLALFAARIGLRKFVRQGVEHYQF